MQSLKEELSFHFHLNMCGQLKRNLMKNYFSTTSLATFNLRVVPLIMTFLGSKKCENEFQKC